MQVFHVINPQPSLEELLDRRETYEAALRIPAMAPMHTEIEVRIKSIDIEVARRFRSTLEAN